MTVIPSNAPTHPPFASPAPSPGAGPGAHLQVPQQQPNCLAPTAMMSLAGAPASAMAPAGFVAHPLLSCDPSTAAATATFLMNPQVAAQAAAAGYAAMAAAAQQSHQQAAHVQAQGMAHALALSQAALMVSQPQMVVPSPCPASAGPQTAGPAPASHMQQPIGTAPPSVLSTAGVHTGAPGPVVVSSSNSLCSSQGEAAASAISAVSSQTAKGYGSHKMSDLDIFTDDAKRREERKAAKRIANRKSASTSRARKKAFVEQLTKTNLRLKRQALILSLIPDLVMAVSPEGTLHFCNSQVEQTLRRESGDLLGSNIETMFVPSSLESIRRIISKLTNTTPPVDEVSASGEASETSGRRLRQQQRQQQRREKVKARSPTNSDKPLYQEGKGEDNGEASVPLVSGTSDTASLDASESISVVRSATKEVDAEDTRGSRLAEGQDHSSVVSSSLTYERLAIHSKVEKQTSKSTTDARGCSPTSTSETTTNEAGQDGDIESGSEDSGYRPSSNESFRERSDSSSTDDDGPNSNDFAPTCSVGLLRGDRTILWCEVTAAVNTGSFEDEAGCSVLGESSGSSETQQQQKDPQAPIPTAAAKGGKKRKTATSPVPPAASGDSNTNAQGQSEENEFVKEVLLCLRPMRDGGVEKMGRQLKFRASVSKKKSQSPLTTPRSNGGPNDANCGLHEKSPTPPPPPPTVAMTKGPPKKRSFVAENSSEDEVNILHKKQKFWDHANRAQTGKGRGTPPPSSCEKSVVESLMLMSSP